MKLKAKDAENLINGANAVQFLPFGSKQAYSHTDIRSFTDYVGGAIDTVLDYEQISPQSDFFYVASGVEINGLKISASVSSPASYNVKDGEGFYFMFPIIGSATVCSDAMRGLSQSGYKAYFSPEIERKGTTSNLSMLQMSIDKGRLNFTAQRMLSDKEYALWEKSLNRPHLLDLTGSAKKYCKIINYLCKMIDASNQDTEILKFMSVDELFYRTFVLMLNGKAISENTQNKRGRTSKDIACRVAEYIAANYNQTINPTDLEDITGASYRIILASFRNNFGCSPLQWHTRQRLEMLRFRLEKSSDEEELNEIAYGCGFNGLDSFRNRYVQQFGETPSQTLCRVKARR